MTAPALDPQPLPTQRLWLAAIKPPMYSVAIMPIWVGSALAYRIQGSWDGAIGVVFTLSAICVLAWTNISNDVFDAETGIDRNKAHSLVNLTQRPGLVFWVGNGFLLAGLVGIGWITWHQRDPTVLGLVLICCALGYVYQGPPFRWGYRGWGEVLCFWAFGPLGVSAALYSQLAAWDPLRSHRLLWAGVAVGVGLATSLILFCSHFHQVSDDMAAGKLSPVVKLGTYRSAQLIPWGVGIPLSLVMAGVVMGLLPLWTLLSWAGLPAGIRLSRLLGQHYDQPHLISEAKFLAVSMHFWYCLFLGLGLVL